MWLKALALLGVAGHLLHATPIDSIDLNGKDQPKHADLVPAVVKHFCGLIAEKHTDASGVADAARYLFGMDSDLAGSAYEFYELGFKCAPMSAAPNSLHIVENTMEIDLRKRLGDICSVYQPHRAKVVTKKERYGLNPFLKDKVYGQLKLELGGANIRIMFPCEVSKREQVHAVLNDWRPEPHAFNAKAWPEYQKPVMYKDHEHDKKDWPQLPESWNNTQKSQWPPYFNAPNDPNLAYNLWDPAKNNMSPFFIEVFGLSHTLLQMNRVLYNRPYHTGRWIAELAQQTRYNDREQQSGPLDCAGIEHYHPVPGYEFELCFTSGRTMGLESLVHDWVPRFAMDKLKELDGDRYTFELYQSPEYTSYKAVLNPNPSSWGIAKKVKFSKNKKDYPFWQYWITNDPVGKNCNGLC